MATNTSSILKSSNPDYTSISTWEDDTDGALGGDIEILEVYNEVSNGVLTISSGVTFAGATGTSTSAYRMIRPHDGDGWEGDCQTTNPATIHCNTTNAMTFSEEYFTLEGMRITGAAQGNFGFDVGADNVRVARCFFDGRDQTFNVALIDSNDGLLFTRNLMLETYEYGLDITSSAGNNYVSNCTWYGCNYGCTTWGSGRLVYKNSICVGNSNEHYADALENWATGTDQNIMGGEDYYPIGDVLKNATAQDTTTPTSGNRVMYTDLTADSEDFHLIDDSNNDALGYGNTLSTFEDTDASGVSANSPWDVGAFNLGSASTEYTKTATVNGIIEALDKTKTASANAYLAYVDKTLTATAHGALAVVRTQTASVSGYLVEVSAVTSTANAYLRELDKTVTADVSGFVETEVVTDARVAIFEHTTGTGTGTRDFTDTGLNGETAKGGIFFCTNATASSATVDDARMSIGWTDGTTHFSTSQNAEDGQATTDTARIDEAHLITATVPGTNNVSGRMAFSALTTNGITGNITTAMDADYVVKCLMFGGTDDCSIKAGSIAGTQLNNTTDVNDVGFEPDIVFFYTHDFANVGSSGNDASLGFGVAWNNEGAVPQYSTQYFSDNSQAAGDTEGVFSDTYACGIPGDYQCEISAFDSSGFSLTARTASSSRVHYLAVKLSGWNISLGSYNVPTSTGTQAYTAPAFLPNIIIEGFTRNTSQDTNQTSGEATGYGFALSNQSEEHCILITDEDGAATSNTKSIESGTDLRIYEDDGTTLAAQATIDSFDSDGYTRDWTTVPGSAFNVWSLCLVATTGAVSYFKTVSVDGYLKDLSKTVTSEAGGLTKSLDKVRTIDVLSYISLEHFIDVSTNALLSVSEVTETSSANAILEYQDQLLTAASDGILETLDTLVTAETGGHLKAIDTLLTVSVNGRLQGGTGVLADATGWLKLVDVTLTTDASGLLVSSDSALTSSVNAIVKIVDATRISTVDGVIKIIDKTGTSTVSGHLKALDTLITASVSGQIQALAIEYTETADAGGVLKRFDYTATSSAEGVLHDPALDVYTATVRTALNTGTGTQQITTTNMGGTPKAAISITTYALANDTAADHGQLCIGLTDGTMSRSIQLCSRHGQSSTDTTRGLTDDFIRLNLAGIFTPDIEAAFSSWVSDGIEINITNAPDAAYLTQLALFGGTTVEAVVGSVTTGQPNVEQDINTIGFEPDVVFCISCDRNLNQEVSDNIGSFGIAHNGDVVTQRSIQWEDDSGDSATQIRGQYETNYAAGQIGDHQIEVGNFDASGFSIWTRTAGGRDVAYLALKIPAKYLSVTDLLTSPTTGDQELDLDIAPDFVMAGVSFNVATATIDTTGGGMPVGVWMADGTDEYCSTMRSEDAADPTNADSFSSDSLTVPDHAGSAAFVGSLSSFDGDGLTINWTSVDATPRYWFLFTIGDDVSTVKTKLASVSGILNSSYTVSVSSDAYCESQDITLSAGVDALLVTTLSTTSSVDGRLVNVDVLQSSANGLLRDTPTTTSEVNGWLFLPADSIVVTVDAIIFTPTKATVSANGYLFRGVTAQADALLKKAGRTVTCNSDGFILGRPGEWGTLRTPTVSDWEII